MNSETIYKNGNSITFYEDMTFGEHPNSSRTMTLSNYDSNITIKKMIELKTENLLCYIKMNYISMYSSCFDVTEKVKCRLSEISIFITNKSIIYFSEDDFNYKECKVSMNKLLRKLLIEMIESNDFIESLKYHDKHVDGGYFCLICTSLINNEKYHFGKTIDGSKIVDTFIDKINELPTIEKIKNRIVEMENELANIKDVINLLS